MNIFDEAKTIDDDEKPVIKRTIKGRFTDEDIDQFLMEHTKHTEPKPPKPKKKSKKAAPKPKDDDDEATYVRGVTLTVCLRTCQDCRHNDHSGAFTPGGAKQICGHHDAYRWATRDKQVNRKDKDDKYHWRHRVIKDPKKIPAWCPLKNGMCY